MATPTVGILSVRHVWIAASAPFGQLVAVVLLAGGCTACPPVVHQVPVHTYAPPTDYVRTGVVSTYDLHLLGQRHRLHGRCSPTVDAARIVFELSSRSRYGAIACREVTFHTPVGDRSYLMRVNGDGEYGEFFVQRPSRELRLAFAYELCGEREHLDEQGRELLSTFVSRCETEMQAAADR